VREEFPSTPCSWLHSHLEGGDALSRSAVNQAIMRIYARPLRAYFDGTRERWLRGGTEIVHGFFADRLDRPEFFAGWQASGKPLRDWLKNAFSFYLREEVRRRRREQRLPEPERMAPRSESPSPEETFDRVYAQEVVREALERARQECEADGLGLHWRIFHAHYYDGVPYSRCAEELGIGESEAAVKARSAVRRFRAVLRALLGRDRFGSGHVDDEIRALLEVTR
jgi:DNA-directed RNA polymerase specialized sigma24 family protein